jgi:hypothetical protein
MIALLPQVMIRRASRAMVSVLIPIFTSLKFLDLYLTGSVGTDCLSILAIPSLGGFMAPLGFKYLPALRSSYFMPI